MGCVYIPVQHSDEEVRVVLNQLPLDANDILDILKAEQVSLDLWLIIAREYFNQGYVEQFQQILEEGSSLEIDEYYADVKYDRIAILNALGAYHSYLGKCESKGAKKDDHFISATKYYKASRIDIHEPSTWVGKGLTLLGLLGLDCQSGLLLPLFVAFQVILTIAVFRVFVGVGEASFVSLAAPFIDDNAPVAQKTAWLAAFYMCIPGGIACGYVLGGLVASHFSWRWAFYGEAILMFPWAVLAFVIKPLSLKGFSDGKSIKGLTSGEVLPHEAEGKQASGVKADSLTRPDEFNEHTSKKTSLSNNEDKHLNLLSRYWKKFKGSRFYKDMKALFDKVYVVNVLGYVAYNFVIGAYSYWGPKAGYGIYHMDNADTLFGGITIICGIVGTLAGGFILDRMNSTIKNAFKLLSGATFLGAIFCFSAFTMKNVYGFFALFAVGELLVFATQAPVNFVCLHCVKPSLRPLSMAVSTICIHIFGDVPSSPLVGELQDQINNWRTTTLILTSILFLAAAIWFIGIFLDSADKFNEESNQKPLLEGNPIELPKSAVP